MLSNVLTEMSSGIKIVVCDARGVCGMLFCDFGDCFQVYDQDGENVVSHIVTGITQVHPLLCGMKCHDLHAHCICSHRAKSKDGTVTIHDEERLRFNNGDRVVFSEVKGMEEVNHGEPRTVKVMLLPCP